MTMQELFDNLSKFMPNQNWTLTEDGDGEVLIHTGMACDSNNNLANIEE